MNWKRPSLAATWTLAVILGNPISLIKSLHRTNCPEWMLNTPSPWEKEILAAAKLERESYCKKITPPSLGWCIIQASNQIIPYKRDRLLYGVIDYWACPKETWEHQSGDCEDIAITAVSILRRNGFPDAHLCLEKWHVFAVAGTPEDSHATQGAIALKKSEIFHDSKKVGYGLAGIMANSRPLLGSPKETQKTFFNNFTWHHLATILIGWGIILPNWKPPRIYLKNHGNR